jgi:hypothetical protein
MSEREPLAIRTAIVAAIAAALHIAVLLGVLPIDEDIEKALVAFVDAVAALVIILTVRPKVTPVVDPQSNSGVQLVPADSNKLPNEGTTAPAAAAATK